MNVTFSANNANVRAAVDQANIQLQNLAFFQRIREHAGFDSSTASPGQIAQLMALSNVMVQVELYTSRWPWSKALAYEDHRFPSKVFLNSRRLDRSLASICATIIHECVHALDATEEGLRFGHGDNNPNGKENTAPYWIGDLAFEMVHGSAPEFAQLFADMDSEWA